MTSGDPDDPTRDGAMPAAPPGPRRPPRCPICGKPPAPATRPFCSLRCQRIDLHHWFGERYRIPAVDDDEEVGAEASPDGDPGGGGEDRRG